jgi:hypothetical protein
MLRILIGQDNLEEASSGKAGIMTGSAPLSGISFFPRKQGSVNRVTEDLFLLKRRQESETEKA